MSELFREGGPYKIQKAGSEYTMSIPLPTDSEGRLARMCPSEQCSPGYFKVKGGTGITGGQTVVYCPYCRGEAAPSDYTTKSQIQYAKDVMIREAHQGVTDMMRKALGVDSSGKRNLGGGFLKMELSLKEGSRPTVHRPYEEGLQRVVVCPSCGLDHAVFGLATWCADCGSDIFLTHVKAELSVIALMLGDVERRETELGPRVAAKDVENCLEDVVSIYEAVLRALFIRAQRARGMSEENLQSHLAKRIGNRFQNVRLSAEITTRDLGVVLFDGIPEEKVALLAETFEKRHPITHNLGVVDRKYLERIRFAEREGREVAVSSNEILQAIETVTEIITRLHARLFPPGSSNPTVPVSGFE
jgi:hypothetical protein